MSRKSLYLLLDFKSNQKFQIMNIFDRHASEPQVAGGAMTGDFCLLRVMRSSIKDLLRHEV